MAHWLRPVVGLAENLVQFPSPTWWLIQFSGMFSSEIIFCPLRALGTHMVKAYACRQNTQTHKVERSVGFAPHSSAMSQVRVW